MKVTYTTLVETAFEFHAVEQSEQFSLRSVLVGKNGYLTKLGMTFDDPVGDELFNQPQLDEWLKQFCRSTSTPRVYAQRIRWWQERYAALTASQGLPEEPRARLLATIELAENNLAEVEGTAYSSKTSLAKLLNLDETGVRAWKSGRVQFPGNRSVLRDLEKIANLLPHTLETCLTQYERRTKNFCAEGRMPEEFQGGTRKAKRLRSSLRRKLPENFPTLTCDKQDELIVEAAQKIMNDPIRKRYSRAMAAKYGLRIEKMPLELQKELSGFLAYKTSSVLPEGVKRHSKGLVRSEKTVKVWEEIFTSFFGWCILPTKTDFEAEHKRVPTKDEEMLLGMGLKQEDLTLGLFLVPELVESYFTWRTYVRSKGPTQATKTLIGMLRSLVREETGFLRQKPNLLDKVPGELLERHRDEHRAWLQEQLEGNTASIMKQIELHENASSSETKENKK